MYTNIIHAKTPPLTSQRWNTPTQVSKMTFLSRK